MNRVQLTVFDYNERAQACYRRCGFVQEGVQRQGFYAKGEYHDVILMSILRQDWQP